MTVGVAESFAPDAMPMLSSSWKSFGNSLAGILRIASGMREPSTARAKMNTVSVTATLGASAALISTRPVIAALDPGEASAGGGARSGAGAEGGSPLPLLFADSTLAMMAV